METFVAATASVVVALIALLGAWLAGRNDRIITKNELEMLKDLPEKEAEKVMAIISRRIDRWDRRSKRSFQTPLAILGTLIPGYSLLILGIVLTGEDVSSLYGPTAKKIAGTVLAVVGAVFASLGLFVLAIVVFDMGRALRERRREIKARNRARPRRPRSQRRRAEGLGPDPKSGAPTDAS